MTLVLRAPDEVAEPGILLPTPHRAARAVRFPWAMVVAAMVTSIVVRARFIDTPLTSDEGGYLAVARSWASGARLYTDAWVDRPQGLVVLFRLWDDLTGGSTIAIRAMAMLFGCAAVAAVAYTVFAVAGARAAGVAAFFVAVASANARIEGFIANGELLAGTVAASGVAAACAYLFRGHSRRWLFVSGAVAGIAISLKQSGCDGLLAVGLCLIIGATTGERNWRVMLRDCGLLIAGLATVLAALFLHGLVVGISAWWYAVAGYRLEGINATQRADWHRFHTTARIAAPTIIPLAAAAVAGVVVWLVRSRRLRSATVLVPAWICAAVVTFLAGGLFHRHYWVTLTFPLAAAAGIALGRLRGRVLLTVACALVLPSLISTAQVVVRDRGAAALLSSDDPRSLANEHIADWFEQHRTPGSTIYALCASAALYARTDTNPPFPYLWQDGVLNGRGAQDRLVNLFAGDNPPTVVVEYQNALSCNASGRVATLLRRRYSEADKIDGLRILVLRAGVSAAPLPLNSHSQ